MQCDRTIRDLGEMRVNKIPFLLRNSSYQCFIFIISLKLLSSLYNIIIIFLQLKDNVLLLRWIHLVMKLQLSTLILINQSKQLYK